MAGLLAYVIERDCKHEWREAAATEKKSAMFQAIETLRPEVERLIGEAERMEPKAAKPDSEAIAGPEKRVIRHDADAICRCGNRFEGGEKFCGKCGAARFEELRRGTQSKLASMWYLQQAQSAQAINSRDHEKGEQEEATLAERPVSLEQIIVTLSPGIRYRWSVWMRVTLLNRRVAIIRNGASATNTIDASLHRKHPATPNLTLCEKLLVSLGLAEPPPAPTYQGNPATQVWIDVHTALYYCPGADLYSKTDGGKIISQREAQQDQFEPANREACD